MARIQKRPKPGKVSGVYRFPNRFLRQVFEGFLLHFTHLFQACVDLGYRPRDFRIANTIVLKIAR